MSLPLSNNAEMEDIGMENINIEESTTDGPVSNVLTSNIHSVVSTPVSVASSNQTASSTQKTTGIARLGLRFAPPEVREMIFTLVFDKFILLHSTSREALPFIFDALRGDKFLYDEALEIYSKTTVFGVNWDISVGVRDITLPLTAIRKLEIYIR